MASVLVTGGRGFLGHLLTQEILRRGELLYGSDVREGKDTEPSVDAVARRRRSARAVKRITVLDMHPAGERDEAQGVEHVTGDVADAATMKSLFEANRFDSVFHLAAVLSGQSEKEFELGMKVNVDATRLLIDCCRSQQAGQAGPPVVVMTSSIAVFGRHSVSPPTSAAKAPGTAAAPQVHAVPYSEDSPVLPQSSYGMEKAVCELLLSDASRRGFVDGRAVRLPTVIVRPGRPNSAVSSFCSGVIREPLQGQRAVCPVSPDLPLWIQSPKTVVHNILHAHNVELGQAAPIITLPGLTTTPAEMMEALAACGGDTSLVDWVPDEAANKIVSSWPGSILTPTADSLGFLKDESILSVVKQHAQMARGTTPD